MFVAIVERISRYCATAAKGVIFVCMAAISVVILAQVFSRYVLGSSIFWAEELARYLMIWMGLVGASLALRQGSHVAITLLLDKLGQRSRPWVLLLGRAVMAVFLFVLIKEGIGHASFFISQKSPAMRISMLWAYSAMYVGGAFMAFHLLHLMIGDFRQGLGKRAE